MAHISAEGKGETTVIRNGKYLSEAINRYDNNQLFRLSEREWEWDCLCVVIWITSPMKNRARAY